MKKLTSLIILYGIIINTVSAHATVKQKYLNSGKLILKQSAHISPEIINELKDFETLISKATIDEIIAKHYLVDGNFRTTLKYLRSEEFAQLQRQLLNVPEIIDVLEFLHLTTGNATTSHMGATKMPTTGRVMTALDEHYDDAVAYSYNRMDNMTANTDTTNPKPETMAVGNTKGVLNNLKVPKRPQQQFYIKDDNNKYAGIKDYDNEASNANSVALHEQELLVHIVLLQDLGLKRQRHHHHHRHHKHNREGNNCYPNHTSLGTFTTFIEEVLEHLPNAAYQNMIKDKCSKNPKFAKFYQALRSAEFKPLIEQIKLSTNVKNIIKTLNSHDVDVNSLEPIAFKVISWGPNI